MNRQIMVLALCAMIGTGAIYSEDFCRGMITALLGLIYFEIK